MSQGRLLGGALTLSCLICPGLNWLTSSFTGCFHYSIRRRGNSPFMPKKKSYNVTEAAKFLGVRRQAVLLAIKKKRLPATWGTQTQTIDVLLIDAKDLKTYRVNLQKQRVGKKN